MKKMLKRNSGFTLIELIVVIAILAILAGVGAVAYSGYINKAHKANDIQLAGDVRYALELAAVTPGADLESGAVILTESGVKYVNTDGTKVSNSKLQAAVEKAFGSTANLKLQYPDWHNEGGAKDFSISFGNSSYSDTSTLLGTVQNLTTNLSNFVKNDNEKNIATSGQFGKYLEDATIDKSNSQAVANAATLFVADKVNNNSAGVKEAWNSAITENGIKLNTGNTNGTGSTLANLAVSYASAQAAVEYVKSELEKDSELDESDKNDYIKQLDTAMNAMFKGETMDEITKSMNNQQSTLNALLTGSGDNPINEIKNAYDDYVCNNNNEYNKANLKAFTNSMNAVNELKGQLDDTDLSSDKLYTGKVTSMVKSYTSAGKILSKTDGSAIAIICTQNIDGSGYTISSYPLFD